MPVSDSISFLGSVMEERGAGDSGLGAQCPYGEMLGLGGRGKVPAGISANKIFTDKKLRRNALVLFPGVKTSKLCVNEIAWKLPMRC